MDSMYNGCDGVLPNQLRLAVLDVGRGYLSVSHKAFLFVVGIAFATVLYWASAANDRITPEGGLCELNGNSTAY